MNKGIYVSIPNPAMRIPPAGNIFKLESPPPYPEELFEPLIQTGDLLIERIISTGQSTPEGEWYDQDRDEWVVLLTGQATLRFDDGSHLCMKAGDYFFIPAHLRHRVETTISHPPCIWLAVHGSLGSKKNAE